MHDEVSQSLKVPFDFHLVKDTIVEKARHNLLESFHTIFKKIKDRVGGVCKCTRNALYGKYSVQ